jgi:hypothetical protein
MSKEHTITEDPTKYATPAKPRDASDPTYPEYTVTFRGNGVPDSPRQTDGPHTFVLTAATSAITVNLVHDGLDPTNPNKPILAIEFV